MIFAVALIAVGLTAQPAKAPKEQGVAKSESAKGAGKAQNAGKPEEPAQAGNSSAASAPGASTNEPPAKASESNASAEAENINIQRWIEIFTGALAAVGVLQVCVMIGQLIIYRRQAREMRHQRHEMTRQRHVMYRQWKAIREQVGQMIEAGKQTDQLIGTMKDTAVRELRAYVCLSEAVIEFRQERAPEVRIYMKNCGKTPAYEVRWWNHLVVTTWPPRQPLPEPPHNFVVAATVLAPGEKPHAMVARQTPIPEQYMPKFGTMELTLYAYGKVTYRDAFGNERFTRYRLMHGGHEPVHLRDKDGMKVGLLKPDYEGNEAN